MDSWMEWVQEVDKRYGLKNLFNLLGQSIKIEGFLEGKFHAQYIEPYRKEMRSYVKEGKVKYMEHVTQGIEQFPAAFVGLMKGHNVGKSVLHV
jgi:NADPH-dependent curcumin reductase CurA